MVVQPSQPPLPHVKQPPLCYVASPLGFSEAGRHYLQTVYIPVLSTVVTPIDPWSLVGEGEIDQAHSAGRLRDLWLEIGRRNTNAIRSSSLLVALLDGQEADSGTVAELGYAAALGKTCFGLRSDVRQCGEEHMAINLQIETFVLDSGGEILSSLASLIEALRRAVESVSG